MAHFEIRVNATKGHAVPPASRLAGLEAAGVL